MNLTLANKNPFSTFDFLGYLFPGALMLILAYALTGGFKHPDITQVEAYSQLYRLSEGNTFIGAVLFVVFAYITGHIVSYLSSVTIELFYTWCYGYPTDYLFADSGTIRLKPVIPDRIAVSHIVWRLVICISVFPVVIAHYVFERLFNMHRFISKPLPAEAQKVIFKSANQYFKAMGFRDDLFPDADKLPEKDIDAHRFVMHYVYEHCHEHIVKFDNYVALYGFLRSLSFVLCIWFLYTEYRFINETTLLLGGDTAFFDNYYARWGLYLALSGIIAAISYFMNKKDYTATAKQKKTVSGAWITNFIVIGLAYSAACFMFVGLILSYLYEGKVFSQALLVLLLFASSYIAYLAFAKFYRRFSLENFMALVICREIKAKEDERTQGIHSELAISDHIVHLSIDKQSSWVKDLYHLLRRE